MLRLVKTLLLLVAALLVPTAAMAAAETDNTQDQRGRLAIVIGNSSYVSQRYEDLANAANDAVRLSDALKRLNFEVATGIDMTASQLDDMFRRYEPKLGTYSAVLIFYAGHGVQFNGENYLLPIDTLDPESVGKLTERAVKLNDVIARFASRDRQTFIFLDACRNNPLGSGEPGAGNGLAQVEVGENSFVAFATQPGNVTVDGAGSNSPFTAALLQSVEIPGLSVSDMMIQVRNETERLTLGKQVPWDQSNLREQFYFTEQQVIDSRQLSATLNRILEVPSMKEKLLVQLASADSDLQSTVLLLGKELPSTRSVEVGTQGQQVASLELGLDGTRKTVTSDIEALLVLGKSQEGGEDKAPGFDLNHRIQTELSRVGCYRQTIDGVWGPGSRKALGEYLRRTKQNQDVLEPNVDLLGDLFLRSGRICRQPVAAKPVKTATMERNSTGKSKARATSQASGRKQKSSGGAARSKPAAPPPDIGAGIGIGGVF
ncbi:caspase family protein [Mesorhizobium sp. LHD-90]|uniref:caspase family protein n=1 Tax=Mesorhizobium sp. LHD-90 TaxID=3071414 RepID=UPI0027DF96BC|nr:caspase family protein [Mesorhizobium sp. LHD-90]MDQ6434692.1 caspase family protein [Mesorhizobium sp. LHD-90]